MTIRSQHVEWPGVICFTLALGIAVSMIVEVVGVVVGDRPLSQGESSLLSTLFGASVGVIGTYLGAHGRHGRRADDAREENGK
jgi:hypothetical protein